MLSGLHQTPVIKAEVIPLVRFWNFGVNAYRANVTFVVEKGLPGKDIYSVFKAQRPLVQHIFNEVTAFKRYGWRAHPVFERRDDLTDDETWVLSRFSHDVLNREFEDLNTQLGIATVKQDYASLASYARESFRLYPSLGELFRSMRRKYSLQASEKRMVIGNYIDSSEQFASPEIHLRARSIFENLIEDRIKNGREGGFIQTRMEGSTIRLEDSGEMDPDFAQHLSSGKTLREDSFRSLRDSDVTWRSINENKAKLGWEIRVETSKDVGTVIEIQMREESIATPMLVERMRKRTQSIKLSKGTSVRGIISAARIFIGVQPFVGYRLINDKDLDLSKSPIFKAIESGRMLIEPIERNGVTPL